jgi:hypothetical protein
MVDAYIQVRRARCFHTAPLREGQEVLIVQPARLLLKPGQCAQDAIEVHSCSP